MCGIIAMIGERNVVPILLAGLQRLEYRGYDSAGIAVINNGNLARVRRSGKVQALKQSVNESSLLGDVGIAHTRWATHGTPSEQNAHPHIIQDRIAIVHNGIIENYMQLRAELDDSIKLNSQTDSEIIAAMIWMAITKSNLSLFEAVRFVMSKLDGAYAIAVLDLMNPDTLIAARSGSPLVIGIGTDENYVASDVLAMHDFAKEFIYLAEGDVAIIHKNEIRIFDVHNNQVERNKHLSHANYQETDKGQYQHYMQKEIFEQPSAIEATTHGRMQAGLILENSFGENAAEIFAKTKNVVLVACGSSFHAAMVARGWLESIAGISCSVEVASEFRYRARIIHEHTLFVCISQSGETADTIAALEDVKKHSEHIVGTLAICNVTESTLVRGSDLSFLTCAGPEIGVASTKALTTQLVALFMLVQVLGKYNKLGLDQSVENLAQLMHLPQVISEFLGLDDKIKQIAPIFMRKECSLFIGRGLMYPIALEGALKLKEISYIYAQAYPAGELKHGPLALVDDDLPVIVLAPDDKLLPKLKSNIQEVESRGGKLLVITPKSTKIASNDNVIVLEVPEVVNNLAPIAYTIPLQLISYHVALLKGTDVDQPRNLAKSVTVE